MAGTPDVHPPGDVPTGRRGLRHLGAIFVGVTVADRLAYAGFLVVLAWGLGVSGDADLFFIVTLLPMTLVTLLSDVCFVVMTRAMARADGEAERWAVAGRAVRVFALLYGVPAVAIAVAAAPLVTLLAPGLAPAQVARAVPLLAWAALLLPGYGLATVLGTILLASGQVATGAARAPLISLTAVAAAVPVSLCLGPSVESLLGVSVASPLLVAAGLLSPVIRCKGHHTFHLLSRAPGGGDWPVIRAALLAACPNVTHAVILLIERAIATTLGPGAVTVLAIGRTVAPLLGAVPAAVGNAGFLDALGSAAGDPLASSRLILYASLLTAIPIAVVMFGETSTVMAVFFQHGRFGPEDTVVVSQIALAFGVGWLHFVLGGSLQRVCQLVRLDTRSVLLNLAGLAVYVPMALAWTAWLGLIGLAIAYGLTLTLISLAVSVAAANRLGWGLLGLPYGRLALIAVAGELSLVLAQPGLALLPAGFVQLAGAGIVSVLSVTAAAWAVDLPGVRPALGRLIATVGPGAGRKG